MLQVNKDKYKDKKKTSVNKSFNKSLGNRGEQHKRAHEKEEKNLKGPDNEFASKPNVFKTNNLTFADTETVIEPEAYDPTINLAEPSLDSLDLIKTNRTNDFLNQIGINPNEYNDFKGSAEQEEFHKTLSKAIENASNLGIEVAPHVREMQQELFKTAYDLNRRNYTDLAREIKDLFEFLNPISLAKAVGNEIVDTVSNPLGYSQRRFDAIFGALCEFPKRQASTMIRSVQVIVKKCDEIGTLASSDLPFLEKYRKIDNAVKILVQTTHELISGETPITELTRIHHHFNNLSIDQRQKLFAQIAIDGFVDYLSIAGAFKTFNFAKYHRTLRNIPYRPQVITVEVCDNPRPSTSFNFAALVEGAAESRLPAAVENTAEQAIRAVAKESALPTTVSEPLVVNPGVSTAILSQAAVAEVIAEKGLAAKETVQNNIAECPPSCPEKFEKLKNELQSEEAKGLYEHQANEIKKIINVTEHGLQRLIERGFTPDIIKELVQNPDFRRVQRDGADVYIKKFNEKYAIMIINEKAKEVVSAMKDLALKKIKNLGENYGWTI